MKIYTELKFQMTEGGLIPISESSFEYKGEVALCDRAATAAAKAAAATAGSAAAQYGGNAAQVNSVLIPGLEREWQNPTGYTPQEENRMLVAGEQGAGGAAGGIVGQANLESARRGNTAGYTNALDETMREKGRILSENALNVKNESAKLAQAKQQTAGQELGSLYGVDVGAQMKGMGIQSDEIKNEIEAGKSGWFQQMTGLISALGQGAQGAAAMGIKPCWVAASFWGWDSPQTHTVRNWVLNEAPAWFRNFYIRHGEWISRTPLRWLFRPVFEFVLRGK